MKAFLLVLTALLATTTVNAKPPCRKAPVSSADQFTLVDGLIDGRSKRFFMGATMPGGELAYESTHSSAPLTKKEEALLAFAAAGINGVATGDVPFHQGDDGNANLVGIQWVGRTFASGDSGQFVTIFITNDQGTWMLKRPQNMTTAEVEKAVALGKAHKWEALYDLMRIKLSDKRAEIPRDSTNMLTFNKWSQNQPGTTYFIPVVDLSALYMNAVFESTAKEMGYSLFDDRNEWKPAGIEAFFKGLPGGYLSADPNEKKMLSVSQVEFAVQTIVASEIGAIFQNLRLMNQALGLGGFPHWGGGAEEWGPALGFTQATIKTSKMMGKPEAVEQAMDAGKMNPTWRYSSHLQKDGKVLLAPFAPPYYRTAREAVEAFAEYKFGANGTMNSKSDHPTPFQKKLTITPFTSQHKEVVIAHLEYLQKTYGRYPPSTGPLTTMFNFQSHVLDPGFYEAKGYKEGTLNERELCRSEKALEKK